MTLPTSRWDAVVIGSGLGGLTTAAYLATNGRRTLVLEQNKVAGGSSQVFRRQGRFEFDVGVHYLGGCGPDGHLTHILQGLGLAGKIKFRQMDPDGFSTLVFPDLTFRVPRGWDRYLERLIETFPDEERGLRRCVWLMRRMVAELAKGIPHTPGKALLFPFQAPVLCTLGMQPLSTLYKLCGLSQRAQAVIAGESGTYAAPPSRVSALVHAATLSHYIEGGAHYPEGGGQVLAAHLVDVIQSHGGTVHTNVRVDRVLVKDGRVTGVRLASGEVISAPVVVSNADVRRTYLDMVGAEHLPESVVSTVEKYRMALPLATVYLALDIDLADRMPNTNFYAYGDYDIEAWYQTLYRGELPEFLPMYLTSATVKDPDNTQAAPPGHSTLELMTVVPQGYDLWQVSPESASSGGYRGAETYEAMKEQIASKLIDQAAVLFPGLRDHIVWQECATPLTQERFTLSSLGTSYGLEVSADQLTNRPKAATAVKGLYMAGGSTASCHGLVNVMRSGVAAAAAVLGRELVSELRRGHVFGDKRRLTAGGPDWDPLMASKPRASYRGRKPRSMKHRRANPVTAND